MKRPETLKGVDVLIRLASRWARMNPLISDYACNVFAVELAKIDILIEMLEKLRGDPEAEEALTQLRLVRECMKRIGEARYLMNAGVSLNLAVKMPRGEER